jgi:pseudomonalisin
MRVDGNARPSRSIVAAVIAATAGAALMSAVGAASATTTAAPASSTVWVPTATRALPLAHARGLGAAPGATPLRLTVGLRPRNRAGLDKLIRDQATPGSASYGHYLTPAQFTATYGATPAQAGAVSTYLTSAGMHNVTVSGNRLQVTADSTVAQAQTAFHTTIARFSQGGRTVLANTAGASVPASLGGDVSAVLGLSTLGFSAAPPSLPKTTGYFPKEFVKVYNAGGTKPGTGTTLAVIAEGNLAPTVTDLRKAETAQKLPKIPVSIVHTGPASSDTSGADEWDLDTQTSTGVAPNASRLYMYDATSLTDSDLSRAINAFANQNVAKSGSASLGECDAVPFLDGSMTVDDAAFAEAAAQGQTFFASTGDTGSSCAVAPTNGVPGSGPPDTEYPASSPYVTGVGGTTLDTTQADVYQTEIAWNAGGGGISPVEKAPAWQSGVVPTAAAGLRGVPDVAFDADPNTGALIYVSGTPEQIGGTSLSSPLALGMWTRLQSSHSNKLGFASPKLYARYKAAQGGSPTPPASVPGFHDIVLGTNGAFTALPGYDFTTGLGSWNVTALSNALH